MSEAHTYAHPMSIASTSLGRNCSTAHLSQPSPFVKLHHRLAGDVHASVGALGVKKKNVVAPLVPLLLVWSVVIATSEAGVTAKAGDFNGSVVGVSGSRTLHKVERRDQWRALIVVRNDTSSRLAADYHSLPRPLRNKLRNTRATCRGVFDKAIPSPAVRKRMTGKYFIDVFGGSGSLSLATNHLGLRGNVLDTKFGLQCDVTQPNVLTRI